MHKSFRKKPIRSLNHFQNNEIQIASVTIETCKDQTAMVVPKMWSMESDLVGKNPNSVGKALLNKRWRKAIEDEINALKK